MDMNVRACVFNCAFVFNCVHVYLTVHVYVHGRACICMLA